MPKSITWKFIRPFMNRPGIKLVNTGKYLLSRTLGHQKRSREAFAAFNFLLDYVPNWERAYGRGGLIQFQSFVPKELAHDVYGEILRISQKRKMPSYLAVVKRHRPDRFLLSHAVDGYSLALDFAVHRGSRRDSPDHWTGWLFRTTQRCTA